MKAEIFTRDNCPYCVKAKHLLTKNNIPYEEFPAGANRLELIDRVVSASGTTPKTVPQIFIIGTNGEEEYIGGYDQLDIWLKK